MQKEKVLQIIALFMIDLIVSFPIAFAQATGEEGTGLEVFVNKLEITDTSGNEIRYFTPGDALLYLELNIKIKELDKGRVSALFLFDGELQPSQCISFPDYTRCIWRNVPYTLKDSTVNEEVVVSVTKEGVTTRATVTLEKEIEKDETKPTISNLKITDKNNNEIKDWISQSLEAYVYIDIAEEGSGLDEKNIKADLSELNIETGYSSVSPSSCTETINGLRCRFDVVIKLNASKTANLLFEARDKAGNAGTATLSYMFKVDNIGPEVTDIKSGIIYNGISYAKEIENKFIATFKEEGVGLEHRDVILDLSELGSGVVPATKCETFNCYWENIAISIRDGSYKVRVSPETKDKLGNKLVGTFEKEIKVDIKAPIVETVEVTPVAGSMPLIEGYIQTGNALLIKAKIYEPTTLTAVGDFSKFIKDAKAVAGNCVQDGNYWECVWETSEINVPGYIVNYLKFNFTDAVGNTELFEYPLIVFAAETTEPDYWTASVGYPSPDGVDLELIALYDPYIYFPVDLVSKGKKVWPLSVEIGDCVNAEGESYGAYLSSSLGNKPELFNYNSLEPGNLPYKIYLKYTLERAEPPLDELPITCTIKIRTLVEGQKISQIEIENVTVIIPYYYNPLGTLDQSIQDEIDRASDSWLVKGGWINTFNSIFKFARIICSGINTIYNVLLIYSTITDVFSGACGTTLVTCAKATFLGTKVTATKMRLHRTYETYANKYCKLLNCQMWQKQGKQSGFEKFVLGRMRKTYSRQGYWGNVDPQHSLILSAVYLCLPGVLYNLQKARVIDCQYVNCLKQSAAGKPVQFCTAERSYGYCKFVWGEFFNLIPFASAISYLSLNVRKVLEHPLEAIGVAISVPCRTLCTSSVAVGCYACTVAENFNLLLEILCDLGVGKGCEPIWDQFKVNDDACKAITEEETKEEGEPVV